MNFVMIEHGPREYAEPEINYEVARLNATFSLRLASYRLYTIWLAQLIFSGKLPFKRRPGHEGICDGMEWVKPVYSTIDDKRGCDRWVANVMSSLKNY